MINVSAVARLCILTILCLAATAASARATRLHLAPGSYGTLVHGTVTRHVFQRSFSLSARAGQTLIVSFTGNGPMRGSVSCRGGGDGPFYGGGDTFLVPATGFCVINAGANPMASDWTGRFTLAVLLSRPGHAIRQSHTSRHKGRSPSKRR